MSFSIGDYNYSAENYIITSSKVIDGWSNQINWQIMADPVKLITLNTTTIRLLEKLTDSQTLAVKQEKTWLEKLKDELTNLLIGVIAFCVVILLIFKLFSMLCHMIGRPVVSVALVPNNNNNTPPPYIPNPMAISTLY